MTVESGYCPHANAGQLQGLAVSLGAYTGHVSEGPPVMHTPLTRKPVYACDACGVLFCEVGGGGAQGEGANSPDVAHR